MIHIKTFLESSSRVFRVAGSVSGPEVGALRDVVTREGVPVRIELSEVGFLDAEGAGLLLDLEARGARLADATPYVELLLRTYQSPASR